MQGDVLLPTLAALLWGWVAVFAFALLALACLTYKKHKDKKSAFLVAAFAAFLGLAALGSANAFHNFYLFPFFTALGHAFVLACIYFAVLKA